MVHVKSIHLSTEIWNIIIGKGWPELRIMNKIIRPNKPKQARTMSRGKLDTIFRMRMETNRALKNWA